MRLRSTVGVLRTAATRGASSSFVPGMNRWSLGSPGRRDAMVRRGFEWLEQLIRETRSGRVPACTAARIRLAERVCGRSKVRR